MMKLSRIVPQRTETIIANWCRRDYTTMSQQYRDIRAKSKNPMDKCYWCKQPFDDGDTIGLAQLVDIGNRAFCEACSFELIASSKEDSSFVDNDRIPITEQEEFRITLDYPMIDRAFIEAKSAAVVKLGIDQDGHSSTVQHWERSNSWYEIDFLRVRTFASKTIYTFVLTAFKSGEE